MLTKDYRPDVDGLRAIAIISVIVFHAFPNLIPGGFVGVDVFFVISGFLITNILSREFSTNSFSIWNFYNRRIKRLFPALIAILITTLVIGWFCFLPSDYENLSSQVLSGSLFASNLFFWHQAGYFDSAAETKMLLHLWSLGVEEQFYIVWPVLLLATHRLRWKQHHIITAILLLSFLINIACIHRWPTATFYLPVTRLWELALGGMIAYWSKLLPHYTNRAYKRLQHIASMLGFSLIVLAIFTLKEHQFYPGWAALLPTIGTALLIFAGEKSLINKAILANPVAISIGLISYPLYLWHWPLLAFLRNYSSGTPNNTELSGVLVASGVLAWLTYQYIEKPIRYRTKKNVTAYLLAVMLIISGAGIAGIVWHGIPSRVPEAVRLLGTKQFEGPWISEHWRGGTCFAPTGDYPAECLDKQPASAPLIVLWGDSHAASLYPGLKNLQKRHQFRIGQFSTSSCPPVIGYDNPVTPGGGPDIQHECRARNQKVFDLIKAAKPRTVILQASWWRYSLHPRWTPFILDEIQATVAALKKAGVKHVVLMGPLPTWPELLPKALNKAWQQSPFEDLPNRTTLGLAPTLPQLNASFKEIANREQTDFIAPTDYFCNTDGCITKFGESIDDYITWDDAHLTPIASEYLMNAINSKLGN